MPVFAFKGARAFGFSSNFNAEKSRRGVSDTLFIVCFESLLVLAFVVLAGFLAKVLAQSRTPATVQITGEAVVLAVDDFETSGTEMLYYVRDEKNGKTTHVVFPNSVPDGFRTGAIVTVGATQAAPQLAASVNNVEVQSAAPTLNSGSIRSAGATTASASTITLAPARQNVIVMLVNLLDQAEPCSTVTCNGNVFGATNSVQSLYAQTSNNQIAYGGRVVGPYTIAARTTDSCPYPYLPVLENWSALADAQAQKAGVDLTGYTEKVYVMPLTNPCGGQRGYSTIGGAPGMAWVFRCSDPEVFTHEMGHNLGMAHASSPGSEYGDSSDIMGNTTIGMRTLNAAHRDQFGWIPAANLVSVKASGTYTIAPLELIPTTTTLPQALKIHKQDTNEDYYFSFRQPMGYDTILPTYTTGLYTNGVSVHRFAGPTASNFHTFFLQGLTDNISFSDAINKITVTQLSHSSSGAQVRVTIGGGTPTLAPASLAFGGFKVGGHATQQTVTLTNPSGTALPIYSVGITGVEKTDFLLSANGCGTSLAAGASCLIGVEFRPVSTGARSAYLAVGDSAGTQEVTLSGTGLNPLSFSPQTFAFPVQTVGTKSAAQNFTLSNTGNSAVTLTKISTAAPFAVASSTCGTTLSAHASCVLGVTFAPTSAVASSGALQVWSNASTGATAVTLSGTGK